ncbi:MAG: radical SAM protein [Candidatus Omnitrophica bacterium]|nr:radical SAM protein [Candidatus Omnitrophota bacterium]
MLKYAFGALRTLLFRTPLNVRLWVTMRCNYRCQTCGIPEVKPIPEMGLDEFDQVAANLSRLGVSQVVLTGGEAFLRSDIVEIIRLFADRHFIVRIQTNGGAHVTEDLLRRSYKAGLQDIGISLDTLDEEAYDKFCGTKDAVKNALRVLRLCLSKYPSRGVISANVVISKKNFYDLPAMMDFVQDLGACFVPCIMTGKFSELGKSEPDYFQSFGLPDLYQADPSRAEQIFAEIDTRVQKGYRILTTSRIWDDLRRYMRTGDCRWRCLAGEISFDITPDGAIAPCSDTLQAAYEQPVLNAKSSDFIERFKGSGYREKCRSYQNECQGCLYGCYRDPFYLVTDLRIPFEVFLKSIRFKKFLH